MRNDHHCFWTGNCIGLRNIKYFTLYLFYLSLYNGSLFLISTKFLTLSAIELIELMFYSVNMTVVTFLSFGLWFVSFLMFMINLKLVLSN